MWQKPNPNWSQHKEKGISWFAELNSSAVGLAEHSMPALGLRDGTRVLFLALGVFLLLTLSLPALVLWLQVPCNSLDNMLSGSDLSGKEWACLSSSCRNPPEILPVAALLLLMGPTLNWGLSAGVGGLVQPATPGCLPWRMVLRRDGGKFQRGWIDVGSRTNPVSALVGQS